MDREILFKIRQTNEIIQKKLEKIWDIRTQLYGSAVRYKADVIQTSGNHDMQEAKIAQVIDMEREVNRMIYELDIQKQKLVNIICRIEKEKYKQVLYRRYIECMKIKDIAAAMDKSDVWVKKTHCEALKAFDEIK